jgi:hypothetical protein
MIEQLLRRPFLKPEPRADNLAEPHVAQYGNRLREIGVVQDVEGTSFQIKLSAVADDKRLSRVRDMKVAAPPVSFFAPLIRAYVLR